MHTRHSGHSSPLVFDLEIECIDRLNQIARKTFSIMNTDRVVVKDVIDGQEDAINNPPSGVPQS